MKTLFARHKWMQLIYGLLILTAGILTIVFAVNSPDDISRTLSVIASITLFIYSAALIFTGVFSLSKKYFDIAFLFAIFFIALGVVLLVNTEIVGQLIVIFVGTCLTVTGVVGIGEATAMIFFKRPIISVVLFYILGAAFLTLGILCYVYQVEVKQIIYVGLGILLCLIALIEVILGIRGVLLAKKLDKLEDEINNNEEAPETPKDYIENEPVQEEPKSIENNDEIKAIDVNDDDSSNSSTNHDA